jgi:hypothetical protein
LKEKTRKKIKTNLAFWKNEETDSELERDYRQVYDIFNDITEGLFEKILDKPDEYQKNYQISQITNFCRD